MNGRFGSQRAVRPTSTYGTGPPSAKEVNSGCTLSLLTCMRPSLVRLPCNTTAVYPLLDAPPKRYLVYLAKHHDAHVTRCTRHTSQAPGGQVTGLPCGAISTSTNSLSLRNTGNRHNTQLRCAWARTYRHAPSPRYHASV